MSQLLLLLFTNLSHIDCVLTFLKETKLEIRILLIVNNLKRIQTFSVFLLAKSSFVALPSMISFLPLYFQHDSRADDEGLEGIVV